ncbi:MAG: HEAT repeat domain-containing protein [Planctomycetes bacterium]|nr:HEAT repeat domain-containing protein [Planctomycetota bacterium]
MADDDADERARRERARRRRAREAAQATEARDRRRREASAPPSDQEVGDEASSIEGGGALAGRAGEERRKWSLDDVVVALRTRSRLLEDGTVHVNEKLLRALAKVGARALPPVLELLDDTRWTARWAALAAVQRIALRDDALDTDELVPRLAAMLEDAKGRVRAKAVEALAALRGAKEEVLPALVRALGDSNAEVSRLAVMHVLELGFDPDDLTERMVEVLTKKRSVYIRVGALLVLLHLGKAAKPAVPHLIEALEDPAPEVREYANLALTAIRTPSMRLQVIRTASMRLKAVEDAPAADAKAKKKPAAPAADDDDEDDGDESDDKPAGPRRPLIRRRRRRLR